jgi:hypothetical protein
MPAYSKARINKLLKAADAATTADAKGAAFEELKGIRVIVLTRADIASLTTSDQLVKMIQVKICKLVIKRTAYP